MYVIGNLFVPSIVPSFTKITRYTTLHVDILQTPKTCLRPSAGFPVGLENEFIKNAEMCPYYSSWCLRNFIDDYTLCHPVCRQIRGPIHDSDNTLDGS